MVDSTLSYGHCMGYNRPVQCRSKVSDTVSPVAASISYGSSIVYMKPSICLNLVVPESSISGYGG
jgi:hypothetical protein